jgi:hypothetical protein
MASDFNRKPTQRAILDDDRLPTHHTFNKRFGGVNEALAAAGLADLKESNLHETLKSVLEYYGIGYKEWVQVGSLIVDFAAEIDGEIHCIDVVQMIGTDIQPDVALMRGTMADPYVDHYKQIADVGGMISLITLLSAVGPVLDTVGE